MGRGERFSKICFTGHRPEKLGYNEDDPLPRAVKAALRDTITGYIRDNPAVEFITGGALGVDTWAAEIVLELGSKLTIAIPHIGQPNKWPVASQLRWINLFRAATNIHFCDKGDYAVYKMMKRNKYMVDESDLVIAVWNGDKEGGTYNCVNYAIKQQKEIINLWPMIQENLTKQS